MPLFIGIWFFCSWVTEVCGGSQRVTPVKSVVVADLSYGLALLETQSNIYFSLNSVGADIWRLLAKGLCESQIVSEIAAEYAAEPAIIEADVAALLSDLLAAGLIRHDEL